MDRIQFALQALDRLFAEYVVAPIGAVLFFDLAFWSSTVELPLVVVWLVVVN